MPVPALARVMRALSFTVAALPWSTGGKLKGTAAGLVEEGVHMVPLLVMRDRPCRARVSRCRRHVALFEIAMSPFEATPPAATALLLTVKEFLLTSA